ncbi:uncharacterized protein SPSC_02665 [Sporisorium scitamineum]|uniref:Uncharacterized protein n=1 Tax=Sporisorium scitamineum TaxID=49012 RepID=A0A0F7S0K7_9BASI|nr:uncharacterized protein SPSC_02665 [Sporisorium scitamineum]CDW95494.1 hypothetical protein [Sporisorium scitamineum]
MVNIIAVIHAADPLIRPKQEAFFPLKIGTSKHQIIELRVLPPAGKFAIRDRPSHVRGNVIIALNVQVFKKNLSAFSDTTFFIAKPEFQEECTQLANDSNAVDGEA